MFVGNWTHSVHARPMRVIVMSQRSMSPAGELLSSDDLGARYDEMFDPSGAARPHCRPRFEDLQAASPGDLATRQVESALPPSRSSPAAAQTAAPNAWPGGRTRHWITVKVDEILNEDPQQ